MVITINKKILLFITKKFIYFMCYILFSEDKIFILFHITINKFYKFIISHIVCNLCIYK